MVILELDAETCLALIASKRVGVLSVVSEGKPYAVPMSYAYRDRLIHAFTLPGRKLDALRSHPQAALLVEERRQGRQWKSALAEAAFEELPDEIGHKREREIAWQLLRNEAEWWLPGGLKPVNPPVARHLEPVFFRLRIERVSGREARDDKDPGS